MCLGKFLLENSPKTFFQSVLYFTLTTIGLTALLIISGFSFKSVLERKQKKTKKLKRRKTTNMRYEQLHQESDSEENYKVQ